LAAGVDVAEDLVEDWVEDWVEYLVGGQPNTTRQSKRIKRKLIKKGDFMRVGVTLEDEKGMDGKVCLHFGQCKYFLIVDIQDNKVGKAKVVPNTASHGGGGCVAVDEILKQNITHIISGGMGMGAQNKFAQAGVEVYGCVGSVKDAIAGFLANSLNGLSSCKDSGDCH